MSPSGHFARVVLLLAALAWPESWQQIQCYTSRCSDGRLVEVDSVHECCVERTGRQFELSPTAESCLRCEVVGWRNKTVIATEGSSVSLFFGYRKGTPSAPRQFQVGVSGDANYTVEPDPSNIEIGADDGSVTLHLSIHSTAEQSPSNRTVTLTLTGPLFVDVNRFIFPSEMRLIVVVPRVQFERSHYSANTGSSDAVSVCLVYDYTPASGSAVDVTVSKEDDVNDVFFSRKFEFSSDSKKSCQEISIPRDKLDSKVDSVFMISIETEPDSALVLGAVSTATLTVAADSVGNEGDKGEEEGSSGDKGNPKAALVSGSDGSDDSWIIAVAVVVPTVLLLGTAIAAVVVVGTVYYKCKHSRHTKPLNTQVSCVPQNEYSLS